MDQYDSSAAAAVWQRVNPQETPYPEAGRGRFEGMMQPISSVPSAPPRPQPMASVMPEGVEAEAAMCRAVLREEMRHMQQVLSLLEKALA